MSKQEHEIRELLLFQLFNKISVNIPGHFTGGILKYGFCTPLYIFRGCTAIKDY